MIAVAKYAARACSDATWMKAAIEARCCTITGTDAKTKPRHAQNHRQLDARKRADGAGACGREPVDVWDSNDQLYARKDERTLNRALTL